MGILGFVRLKRLNDAMQAVLALQQDVANLRINQQESVKRRAEASKELRSLTEETERLAKAYLESQEQLTASKASTKEAWERTKVAGFEKEEAVARIAAAEEMCARITACHATRVRIGSIPTFDAIEMTARVRVVEGSLRCEADGAKIVAYGDRQISDAEWNALVAAATPQWNRT